MYLAIEPDAELHHSAEPDGCVALLVPGAVLLGDHDPFSDRQGQGLALRRSGRDVCLALSCAAVELRKPASQGSGQSAA